MPPTSLNLVSKSQSKYGILDSPKKRTKHTILSTEVAQDTEFHSFLGTIDDTIICFRDLLTFTRPSRFLDLPPYLSDA